jgi:very-short-patch-repair endonuclease
MGRTIIPYNPKLKELAKALRNNSTPGEIALWKKIRDKQLLGYDFDRQKPLGEYIVDFFCHELMLAVEIDGISHENQEAFEKDIQRQKDLEGLGIQVLRFKEHEAVNNVRLVLEQIEFWIHSTHPLPLSPTLGRLHRGE